MANPHGSNPPKGALLVPPFVLQPKSASEAEQRSEDATLSSNLQRSVSPQPWPYLFITTTDESADGRPDDQLLKLARSHVSTSLHHRKGLQHPAPATEQLPALGGMTAKFKLPCWSAPKRRKKIKSRSRPGIEKGELPQCSKQHESCLHEELPESSNSRPGNQAGAELECEDTEYGLSRRRLPSTGFSLGRPQTISSAGPIDPFATAPLPLNSRMQRLVHHYVSDYPDSVHPIRSYRYHSQSYILKMAMTNQALLHAILALSRIHTLCFGVNSELDHVGKIRFVESDPEVLYHHLKAMNEVNKKLEIGDVSDATIATVLILLLHHPWINGKREADIHFSGLKQMIHCRGGLENLPSALASAIAFHDLKRAVLNCAKPYFPIRSRRTALPDITISLQSDKSIFQSAQMYLISLIGTELWQIFRDLYYFTRFVGYYRAKPREFRTRDSGDFEAWNTSIAHRLLSYSTLNAGRSLCDNMFKEALCTAGILWMDTGLWNYPPCTSMVQSTASHLVKILALSDLSYWREQFGDITFWILVVGLCCTSEQDPQRFVLLSQLKVICVSRKFDSPNDFEGPLRNFIYADGVYSSTLASLWIEITGLQLE